jgi:tetratricopeptide (TPR) repeat protein
MKNKKLMIMLIIICIFFIHSLPAAQAQNLSNSFIVFRDSVYMQNRDLLENMRLYATAKQEIENLFYGANMYLALARCEYLMGITFKAENRNSEAAAFFEQGIAWAEESIAISPTSEGYLLLGSGISFLCEINTSYGLRNHKKIEANAKRALELDPNNLMAKHLIASYYILAPWPFSDVRRGTALLEEIITQNYLTLNQDDLFNLYLMLQVASLKQKRNQEAQIWREKAASIYPSNNFITMLM